MSNGLEQLELTRRALNRRARYQLAFRSALAVLGCDAVEIDELTRMALNCDFEALNRRMRDVKERN